MNVEPPEPSNPEPEPAPAPEASLPTDANLRARPARQGLTRDMKRFDIFLIDTGWNTPVSRAVHSHVRHLFDCHPYDSLYILSREQSYGLLQQDPKLIGHDPTILVYDLYGSANTREGNYRGFRLNLGLLRNAEQATYRLQEFVRFIAVNRDAENLDREIRKELHREGVDGMIKVMRETSLELVMG